MPWVSHRVLWVSMAALQLIISKNIYCIWLWIDLMVGIFKSGVSTGWKSTSVRKKLSVLFFLTVYGRQRWTESSFLCVWGYWNGRAGILAGLWTGFHKFLWPRVGGWGRVFLSKACEAHTHRVWIFQLATADPFDFVTRWFLSALREAALVQQCRGLLGSKIWG